MTESPCAFWQFGKLLGVANTERIKCVPVGGTVKTLCCTRYLLYTETF